ncbi:MAG: aspartate aminotransferase family protein, partial [Cyanobacteria bacterium REEB65]|nr:aspartate aminotransferase family protein [Cyanobacteria bacterium REEB65]
MISAGGFPGSGLSYEALVAELEAAAAQDASWRAGRTWSLVYHADAEVEAVVQTAYTRFMAANGLSPAAFPSLQRFESEVLAGISSLLHAPEDAAGSMTSGGTESLLMAVKT